MINQEECFYLGYLSKTYGIKGELIAKLDVDTPDKYQCITSLFIELAPNIAPVSIAVLEIRISLNGVARILFEGINTIEKAKPMVGKSLFLPLTMLPSLKENLFYFHEIIGFDVLDVNHGNIGKVDEVLEYPHQAIIQVKNGNKEILIPAIDKMIVKVDRKNNILEVNTPDGLIDVYLGNA